MKNLLKMAVVALALSCFQAYGHPVCVEYSHDHVHQQDQQDCHFVCNKEDAACKARRIYNVGRIIRVRHAGQDFLVTFMTRSGEVKVVRIELYC